MTVQKLNLLCFVEQNFSQSIRRKIRWLAKNTLWIVAAIPLAISLSSTVNAQGHVILGGDDLDDHGSNSGSSNLTGWLYIEEAVTDLLAATGGTCTYGAGSPTSNEVAVLGSSLSMILTANGGAAAYHAVTAAGGTLTFHDGPAAITTFFANLGGSERPEVIYIPTANSPSGGGVPNGLSTGVSSEEEIIEANATAIRDFINLNHCGLMAHSGSYNWLATIQPGLTTNETCSIPLTPTAIGSSTFPSVTSTDLSGGPCHNEFLGTIAPLDVLATDTASRNIIIGGSPVFIGTQQILDVSQVTITGDSTNATNQTVTMELRESGVLVDSGTITVFVSESAESVATRLTAAINLGVGDPDFMITNSASGQITATVIADRDFDCLFCAGNGPCSNPTDIVPPAKFIHGQLYDKAISVRVPTLNGWGMILTAMLLASIAIFGFKATRSH